MSKILFINACVRKNSRTYALAQEVLACISGDDVEEVNLEKENIQPLNWEKVQQRENLLKMKLYDDPLLRYAYQFAQADEIVIAAPYWDFMFPAIMKIYLEAVCVNGVTFCYTPQGQPMGLCKAKHIYYVTTAGGPIGQFAMGFDYIKALSQTFYGIQELQCFFAENLDITGADVNAIMNSAKIQIQQYFL